MHQRLHVSANIRQTVQKGSDGKFFRQRKDSPRGVLQVQGRRGSGQDQESREGIRRPQGKDSRHPVP